MVPYVYQDMENPEKYESDNLAAKILQKIRRILLPSYWPLQPRILSLTNKPNTMDIYKDGYIYTDVQTNRKMAIISFYKKYPCPQPHPDWKDVEDVTGKYQLEQWCNNQETLNGVDTFVQEVSSTDIAGCPCCYVIAAPIPTEQPTVKGVDVNGDEYPRLPLDAPTEQPSGIVLGKVERLNPDGSKTLISDGYSAEQPKEQSDYWKVKYEKCIDVIKRFDPGIIGMYDL